MKKIIWLMAAWACAGAGPVPAFAYPELRTSHSVEIVSAAAVRHIETDRPELSRITVTADLLFGNTCMIPDVLFKDRNRAPGLVQIWIRGASRRDMMCPMIYQPVTINAVVDNETWNSGETPRIEVNGMEINLQ